MENHVLAAAYGSNMLGQEDTPVRANMEAIVQRIGLDYIINVVMTPYGQVIDVLGGHFVAAQRAAVQVSRRIYSVPFKHKSDIVISNAYPGEIDLWQGSKGIWAGEMMVKAGGTVILNAPCDEGIGPHPEYLQLMTQQPDRLERDIRSGLLEDRNVAAGAMQIAQMLDHMNLAIVSAGLKGVELEGKRIACFTDLQVAVDHYLSEAGPDCRVSTITHGGYTYPLQL
jgi:nickel-dependent lactate racemase